MNEPCTNRAPWKQWAAAILTLMGLSACAAGTGWAAGRVTVLKTPGGGIQPQSVVDGGGSLHLIYFKGEAAAGDLFYVRREAGEEGFSDPIRVNSLPGSAVAIGSIRGGQIALGKAGRIHVAWNGSSPTKGATGTPMFYARWNDAGTGFEAQRNLMQVTSTLDGGGTVAADGSGNVFVAWHAREIGGKAGEEQRRVWVTRSVDDGKTFAKEAPGWTEATGACACCSTRAFAGSNGLVYILYRSAQAGVKRDMYLLTSRDKGNHFQGVLLHPWEVPG